MSRRIGKWVGTVGLLLFVLSCTALPDTGPGFEGREITLLDVAAPDLVPIEWGTLVAVTTDPGGNVQSNLWFQDESGTIRLVGYDLLAGQLWPQATVFRRR